MTFQKSPKGWQWAQISPREGQFLRFGWTAGEKPRALCVIFPGLSEFCEKYYEVANELISRNFAVAVIDWRGQGQSWRHLPDHDKRHHDDFTLDEEDALAYLSALGAIPALSKLPRIILAHSMGGHIALRALHAQPDAAKCLVTTAPMFGINLPLHMDGPARLTAEAACRIGWADHYVVGAGPWSMSVFTNNLNLLTSDTQRRANVKQWLQNEPALRMGGLTFGWVRAALATSRLTQDPAWLASIATPCLIFVSGREMIVSNAAIRKGARCLQNATLVDMDDALHEVMMEKDTIRTRFWQAFDSFIANHLNEG